MTTPLLPIAEQVLGVGVHRALRMVQEGNMPEARRALEVALSAAELLNSERETLEPTP